MSRSEGGAGSGSGPGRRFTGRWGRRAAPSGPIPRSDGPAPPRPETEFSQRARFVWAGRIGGLLLRLWGGTWRIRREIDPLVREWEANGTPFLHGFFHEHILSLSFAYRYRRIVVLVSQSEDGEYISQIIHRLGYGTVRGSSSRGGVRALLAMARTGAAGFALSVTPDGPRGPRRIVQPGVLHIAARSGQAIVPLGAAAHPVRRLNGWDRFEVPLPFSTIQIVVGEPIPIPSGLDPAELESRFLPLLQDRFEAVEARALALLGRSGS